MISCYDTGGDSVGTLPFQFQGMGYSADSSTSAGSSSFCAESPAISDVQDFRPVQWDVFLPLKYITLMIRVECA